MNIGADMVEGMRAHTAHIAGRLVIDAITLLVGKAIAGDIAHPGYTISEQVERADMVKHR